MVISIIPILWNYSPASTPVRIPRAPRESRNMDIRPAAPRDATAIAAIYNHYVAHTCITFETDAVTDADMAQRIDEVQRAELPWLVAVQDDDVLGYAYASKWKGRCAYRFSVESTVYLDPARTGQGIGKPLYAALIERLRDCRDARRHRWHRLAERRQHRVARAPGLPQGRAFRRGGIQAAALDRRRLLAAAASTDAAGNRWPLAFRRVSMKWCFNQFLIGNHRRVAVSPTQEASHGSPRSSPVCGSTRTAKRPRAFMPPRFPTRRSTTSRAHPATTLPERRATRW